MDMRYSFVAVPSNQFFSWIYYRYLACDEVVSQLRVQFGRIATFRGYLMWAFQMAEKNPDLHLFKEEFDLDLEY